MGSAKLLINRPHESRGMYKERRFAAGILLAITTLKRIASLIRKIGHKSGVTQIGQIGGQCSKIKVPFPQENGNKPFEAMMEMKKIDVSKIDAARRG